ncbi:LuxR family transcriptional regulator [Amycolatopsis sp. WAC 04182]|uniref:ATP-binding protein n=1 Tax=Amycolatopsis sp. WAC 04182 TaxID=2203198 RepID=UPI000F77D7D2|nr:LuxR family transcriptional regulator [Amycolatopsis sp. WAC 04182]RSN62601.1 LuxR family transcriptional regulator [Amycolatopsis sp. WAC 04182]
MNREPFVGRAAELAILRGRLADAAAGSGGLVLVSGPPGIGKTRLVEEAVSDVAAVVWGRCADDPGAPPLWPWRRVVEALPSVDSAVTAAFAETEGAADVQAARFRLVAAASDALVAAAGPAGLVVVLEDLHWADEASLRLLRHLAGELRRSKLAVIATHRDTGHTPALDAALPDLLRRPGARSISLPPLAEPEARALLTGLAEEEAREAYRRSGGNPLYLGAIARSAGGSELGHLVRATVAGLASSVRRLLAIAAVIGEDVEAALLAEVSALSLEEVADGLDRAAKAGVLREGRFAHAVVRDGIYADLGQTEREALHGRVAAALEAHARRDPALAGTVAGHWLRSASAPVKTAEWAAIAAAEANRALAFDEAARFLAIALDARAKAGLSEVDRAGLLLDLAVAEYRTGRFARSLDHARRAADAGLLARAALVVRDVAAPDLLPGIRDLATRALAADGVDRTTRARLLAHSASVEADYGRFAEAGKLADEAFALAEESGDPEALIDAVRARMKVAPEKLPLPERLRLGALAAELGARTGQPLVSLWGHKWRIDAALEDGRMALVDDELVAVTTLARLTRLPLVRWHDLRLRSSVLALRGDLAEARALDLEAEDLADTELADDFSAKGMSYAFRTQLVLLTGDPGDLRGDYASLLERAPHLPVTLVSRPLLSLLMGDLDEARVRYEQVVPLVRSPEFAVHATGALPNLVPLVEAFHDTEMAEYLLRRLEEVRPIAAGGAGVFCTGSTLEQPARLNAVLGRHDEAVRLYERTIAVNEGIGARPGVAQARLLLAETLVARGDLVRAQGIARDALAEFRRLAMPGPLARAAALLDRIRAGRRAADPLTGREREIVALLADALSNRRIAEKLVLSERTVESHVRSILAKLGLANRTEVVAWASREGLRD